MCLPKGHPSVFLWSPGLGSMWACFGLRQSSDMIQEDTARLGICYGDVYISRSQEEKWWGLGLPSALYAVE